ncbi:hypothetical protein S83_041649 [Arachis hypogaea]
MVASSKSSFLIEKDENNHTLGGRKRDSSVTFKIEALYSQEILNSELERSSQPCKRSEQFHKGSHLYSSPPSFSYIHSFTLLFTKGSHLRSSPPFQSHFSYIVTKCSHLRSPIIHNSNNYNEKLQVFAISSPPLAKKVGAEFIGTFIYADFCQNSGGNNEREDQLIGNSYGLRCRHRPCGDGDHPVHRTHIRCSSEPCGHHLLCCLKALSMEEGANVYWNTDIGISVCRICTEGVYHPFMGGGVTVPSGGYGQAFTLEFIISFNLMFVVTVFATDTRTVGQFAGMAVGATVTFNILIAGYVLLSKSASGINEPSKNTRSSNCSKQLQSNLNLFDRSNSWCTW